MGAEFPPMPEAMMPQRSNQPSGPIESRLEFETLISDTSADLFAAPPDQVEPAVERALHRVREFFRADRCALLSVSADQQLVNVRLASYAEGVSAVAPGVNLAPMFTWAAHRLLVERLPVRISRVEELPPEATVDRTAREGSAPEPPSAVPRAASRPRSPSSRADCVPTRAKTTRMSSGLVT